MLSHIWWWACRVKAYVGWWKRENEMDPRLEIVSRTRVGGTVLARELMRRGKSVTDAETRDLLFYVAGVLSGQPVTGEDLSEIFETVADKAHQPDRAAMELAVGAFHECRISGT